MLEEAKSGKLQGAKIERLSSPRPLSSSKLSESSFPPKKNQKENRTRDISNFCNTRQRCRSTCYFAMSVRVATGFRFVSLTEEAAAPLSQEDARLLRDIPGRNCRSLIPRCLIPFDYHPIAALPILYVDESHCLPLFPIATFPPHPRQSNRRRTETKEGTSSSSSSSSPNYSRTCFSSWKDFHPIPLASASTNDPIDSIHVVYLARHGQYRDNDNDSFFFLFKIESNESLSVLFFLLVARRIKKGEEMQTLDEIIWTHLESKNPWNEREAWKIESTWVED